MGNLVSSKEELENLYLRTYVSRLTPNPMTDEIKEIIEVLDLETSLARYKVNRDWTMDGGFLIGKNTSMEKL